MVDMATPKAAAADLARAMDYPYDIPSNSYVFAAGRALTLHDPGTDPLADGWVNFEGGVVRTGEALGRLGIGETPGMAARVAVLAYGSNAAPEQLGRKFVAADVIPVIRARLSGFDVVYAPHFTRYGTIPGTLAPSPGTITNLALSYLTGDQLAVMHETEMYAGNYVFGCLRGIELTPRGLAPVAEAHGYVSPYGNFNLAGAPVSLAAIDASPRRFAAMITAEVLARARDDLAPGQSLTVFIRETIADGDLRRDRTLALRRTALAFEIDAFQREI